MFLGSLSHHNKDLEQRTLEPSARHRSQSWTNRVIALRQISVTALFYLEDSRRIHPWSVRACQHKDLKGREWRSAWERGREREKERERAHPCGRGRESDLAPPYMFLPPPGPARCKLGLARSAVCSTWSLHSGPQTFFCSIITGFSFPCLLATAILNSFFLFYLPNILYVILCFSLVPFNICV